MGTRGFQKVINKAGEIKLQQYNQWDSYPSGLGIEVINFFRTADLQKYQENLDKIPQITEEQGVEVDKTPNWQEKYPYLSRDCGGAIHDLILNGKVKFVSFIDEEEANKWCEGFLTIDFTSNKLTYSFGDIVKTYPLDKLPTDIEFLKDFLIEEE